MKQKIGWFKITHHVITVGMGCVVDFEPVIAVDAKVFESQEEPLQDGLGLKRYDTIYVSFIP